MAIAGCDLPTFATRLNEVLTLSVPVRTPEKLFGRDKQLETIQLALHSPGRHVFIYGDRGPPRASAVSHRQTTPPSKAGPSS